VIDTVGDVLRAVVRVVFAVSCVAALASCSKSSSSAQNYVALGDSYAAGTLTGEISGDPAGCLRSEKDYPHVVQHTLAAKAFTDVTCSSATSADLGGPQHVAGGTNPPQLDAITSSTTLVTLTIGGNDIGFLSIIEHCASLTPSGSPCKDHYTSGGTDQLSRRIAATAPKIAAVLAAVHSRAPKARILLVGYPDLLPPGGVVADVGCGNGQALIFLAKGYPEATLVGFDAYPPAVAAANANAQAAGLADRLRYEVCDVTQGIPGSFDLVTTFDVVHDMPRPRPALKEIKQSLKPDGSYFVLEFNFFTDLQQNIDHPFGIGAFGYSASIGYCMTTALAVGGEGTGTCMGETKMREFATEAGLGQFRRLDFAGNPFNIFYELRV